MSSDGPTKACGACAPRDPKENFEEELRLELHRQVDGMFEGAKNSSDIYCDCLRLAGRLVAQASPYIDLIVARELAAPKASTSEVLAAGERGRDDVKAFVYGVDGRTAESTAALGLIGAHTTINLLAIYTADPYLRILATALGELRYGQVHPWLVPVKTPVHPKERASDVLTLKAKPFCVIDYLVRSGLHTTKTAASAEVVARLGISEDTLKVWRQQQRKLRPVQFEHELQLIAHIATEVRERRRHMKTMPESRAWVEAQDNHFGLSAMDWVARALQDAGAHKGQK